MICLDFDKDYRSPVCLALGFFDSVHLGHRELIRRMKSYSVSHGALSCVFTFDNDLGAFFDKNSKQVYTFSERKEIFEKLGADIVFHRRFDRAFMQTSAEDFLSELFSSLNIKKVFCGYDYSFGSGGKGDTRLLEKFCEKRSAELEILPKIEYDGERVSTTLIKKLLAGGEISQANRLLEDPFWVCGNVVHGRSVGHLYGFPTANIDYPSEKILPKHGVYGTIIHIGKNRFKGVTNIGPKPTFDVESVSVETLIDGTVNDLYGKEIKIEFIKYLRGIEKFDTPDALSAQIHKDLNWRREC